MTKENTAVPRWLPLLVGIGVLVATLWLWRALSAQEQRQIGRMIKGEAASVQNEITAHVQSRILALVRMARRWENVGKPSQEEWEAELTVSHFPGYQAIAWVDPWLFMRWGAQLEGNEAAQDLDLSPFRIDRLELRAQRIAPDFVTTRNSLGSSCPARVF